MKMQIVQFQGASQNLYNCGLYSIKDPRTPQGPGVYIFIKPDLQPVYIGQSHDLRNRICADLENHHSWECIQRAGATHVATYEICGTLEQRFNVETDLRHRYSTICNRQ